MDYDSDSSDFHFPSDTGLAKLSSPLSFKVPEARDWALDEFMQTLSEKPCMESDNITSFKHYLPVTNETEDQDFNYGPPKLTLPTYEEKDFMTQLTQHFLDIERKELHDILKGGFNLVQNDIQTNSMTTPFNNNTMTTSAHPDISWFDEAFDYGYNNQKVISDLEHVDFRRNNNSFSPFEQQHHYHRRRTSSSLLEEESILSLEEEQEPHINEQPIEMEKPLPPLPPLPQQQKKGLKYKLQSKLKKTFNKQQQQQEKPQLLAKTKKWMRKFLFVKH